MSWSQVELISSADLERSDQSQASLDLKAALMSRDDGGIPLATGKDAARPDRVKLLTSTEFLGTQKVERETGHRVSSTKPCVEFTYRLG